MAVLVPIAAGYAGAAAGGAIAAGLGVAGLGAMAVSALASTIVTSAVTGGLDNFFDDPMSALTQVAVGTFMGYASKNIMGGFSTPQQGAMASGISAGAAGSGTVYEGMMSSIDKGVLGLMDDSGSLNSAIQAADGVAKEVSSLGVKDLTSEMQSLIGDEMFARTKALNLQQVSDSLTSLNAGDSGLSSYAMEAQQAGSDFSFMSSEQNRMLREQEIYGDFGQKASDIGSIKSKSPFTYEGEKASGFADYSANKTGEALQSYDPQQSASDKLKKPQIGGGLAYPDYSLPQAPISGYNADTGSIKNVNGMAGVFGEGDLYNNPVVQPMVQAYQRQQERATKIANQSWGLLNTTRTKGLMS